MELLKLIDELEDLIEESSSIPFSGKIKIDKKKMLDILGELRLQLPDEIKQAQWINSERQRLLLEAQEESEDIVNNAKKYIQEQVQVNQIVKEAEKKAETIINQANFTAKEIKIGAREYADNLLNSIQEDIKTVLDDVGKIYDEINNNREQLK